MNIVSVYLPTYSPDLDPIAYGRVLKLFLRGRGSKRCNCKSGNRQNQYPLQKVGLRNLLKISLKCYAPNYNLRGCRSYIEVLG